MLGLRLAGLGLERFGVTADAAVLGLDGGKTYALIGEPGRAAEAFAQTGQGVPGLLGGGQTRRVLAQLVLEHGLLLARFGDRGLDRLAAILERGLVGELLLDHLARLRHVIGEESGTGIAYVGLDHSCATSHLGLATEWLELTAQLGEDVVEAGQVALRRIELAERLLLALAVLEHAGGFFDEAAALLRCGAQDAVELALADDDVHLAADAGVAQELLDIEESAGVAVDRVLRTAVAEHRAGDRDLGVFDRQCTVGVVDREHDLGSAQRRAARRTGEDDVFHLAAAQRLGALLAHDPGERVDDIGLAGSVGTDDTGDAGLELESR